MTVTLKTLLNVAPFPESQREELLNLYNQISEEQKMRLSIAAWTAISQLFFSKLKNGTDKLLLEIQEGKRKYNINDFKEIEARLLHEFAQKLKNAQDQVSIEDVKQQLEKFKTP